MIPPLKPPPAKRRSCLCCFMADASLLAAGMCHWTHHWVGKHIKGINQRLARLGVAWPGIVVQIFTYDVP